MKILPHLHTKGYYRTAAAAFFFIQGLVFASWASRIPDIKDHLGLNEAELGGILFAIPVGQLLAMALSGYLVSRYGSRKILTIAAVLYPLSLIFIGAVNTSVQLIAALLFFGVTANLCNISVNTHAVGVERIYNRSIMGVFHGLWSFAGFCGGLISTVMVSMDITPFNHFIIIFAVSTILLISARTYMLPRDYTEKPRNDAPKEKKRVFVMPDKFIFLLGLIAFGGMVCEGTMFDWSSVYFESVIDPPKNLVRLGYIAFMSTMALGRFTADKMVTRFDMIPVIRVSGLLIAAGLLISVIFPYLISATAGFLLVGFGVSSIIPLCYSMAGKSKTMIPSIALATVSTIGFFGFLLGPPVIGFIAHASSLRWSFAVIAMVGLLTSIFVGALKKVN
ncbi:MAG: MFS transporter [Rikenellaceae bacterium]|nr:MFS transporter [Rikenellaceae bacterium]